VFSLVNFRIWLHVIFVCYVALAGGCCLSIHYFWFARRGSGFERGLSNVVAPIDVHLFTGHADRG